MGGDHNKSYPCLLLSAKYLNNNGRTTKESLVPVVVVKLCNEAGGMGGGHSGQWQCSRQQSGFWPQP